MVNRTFVMLSVTIMIIIIIFNFIILGYSMSQGISIIGSTMSLCYLFFIICAILGAFYTFLSYRKNNPKLLLVASFLLFIASIPNILYIIVNHIQTDAFLLTKFCIASFVINLITYYLAIKNIDLSKQKTLLSESKKVMNKKRKK
ncbi:MAG: hypothetical protein LBR40_01770 [Bacilli bacterium]|nr:hypothetical protein [Bacilli bacterium]